MRHVLIRLCFAALIAAGLAACQSVTLIDLNREFVALVQQSEEAKRLYRTGGLDRPNYDAAVDGYRVAFAQTGDKAVDAAGKARTPRNKVSFLSLAARSYLKSGQVGDAKIPDLAARGRKECAAKGMEGLNGLPVTCGYFYIVTPQAVSNEWQRKVEVLRRRVQKPPNQPRGVLTASDGQALKRAFAGFIGQLDAIETNMRQIDLANADQRFRGVIYRQQNIVLCNARRTRRLTLDVDPKDRSWDRESVKSELKREEDAWVTKLRMRPVGFPDDTCSRLENPGDGAL